MSEESPRTANRLYRGFAGGRTVRFLAVQCTPLAQEVQRRHELCPRGARIAAEGTVAAVLMSAYIKGDERLTIQLQGEVPRFAFVAEVDGEGGLRGRLTPKAIHGPETTGIQGLMLNIKADAKQELYRGMTELRNQSITDALAAHMNDSTQVDVVLRIAVDIAPDGQIQAASGLMLERLPEHPTHPWIDSHTFRTTYDSVASLGVDELLASAAFGKIADEEVEVLETRDLHWRCSCSLDRIVQVVRQLGAEELESMLAEQGKAEVTCHFCNDAYVIGRHQLEKMLVEAREGAI
jgi:molecular chaperone Hsp33